MIEALNSQCNTLKREYQSLKNIETHQETKKLKSLSIANNNDQIIGPSQKRRKVEDTKTQKINMKSDYFKLIVGNTSIMTKFSSYLDPLSLKAACMVSKYWNTVDEFYKFLCEKRFGAETSRQYKQGKMNWNDTYQEMDRLNILPLTSEVFGNVSGSVKTADLCAWISIIDRSTGYLNRAVKVKDKEDGGIDICKKFNKLSYILAANKLV